MSDNQSENMSGEESNELDESNLDEVSGGKALRVGDSKSMRESVGKGNTQSKVASDHHKAKSLRRRSKKP